MSRYNSHHHHYNSNNYDTISNQSNNHYKVIYSPSLHGPVPAPRPQDEPLGEERAVNRAMNDSDFRDVRPPPSLHQHQQQSRAAMMNSFPNNEYYKMDYGISGGGMSSAAAASLARMRLLYEYRAPAGTRWSPTARQLQELQTLFHVGGLRTPTTAQISQITARLRRHGRIEGRNVFYWFQNQKARERKHRSLCSGSISISNNNAPASSPADRPQDEKSQQAHDDRHGSNPPSISATMRRSNEALAGNSNHAAAGQPPGHRLTATLPLTDRSCDIEGPDPIVAEDGTNRPALMLESAEAEPSKYVDEIVDPREASIGPGEAAAERTVIGRDHEIATKKPAQPEYPRNPIMAPATYYGTCNSAYEAIDSPTKPAAAAAALQLFPLSPVNLEEANHAHMIMNCDYMSTSYQNAVGAARPYHHHHHHPQLQSFTASNSTSTNSDSSLNSINGNSCALNSLDHINGSISTASTSYINPNWLDLKLAMNY